MASQLLAESPQCLGIQHGVLRRKPEKAPEGCPVADLELGLVIGEEVVECLQHQHFEHQHHVMGLASGVALVLFLMNDLQQRTEGLPIDDAVEPRQRIAQFIQLGQPILLVEEARLHIRFALLVELLLLCRNRTMFRGAPK
jgi:hypothetical protein